LNFDPLVFFSFQKKKNDIFFPFTKIDVYESAFDKSKKALEIGNALASVFSMRQREHHISRITPGPDLQQ
jgi:hypothetical protein